LAQDAKTYVNATDTTNLTVSPQMHSCN